MPNSRYRELYWDLVVMCMLCFVVFELFDEELEGKAEVKDIITTRIFWRPALADLSFAKVEVPT